MQRLSETGLSGLKIELMNERHLDKVSEIENKSFSEPWRRDALKNAINDDKYRFYCLVDDHGEVISYVGIFVVIGEGEIVSVATNNTMRGQGFGGILLSEVILREKELGTDKLFLEVRESNAPAISLYKKMGFATDGIRKNFYRKPVENAILMSLEL